MAVSFELNNGLKLPAIGLGTFQGTEGNSRVKDVVLNALKIGYRHIDGAAAYGNEREIGEAIKESGIPRADIFVTTKLAQTWHQPSDVGKALDESLKALQLDYIDLYLMHFPHAYVAGLNHTTVRHSSGKPLIDFELSRAYPDVWKAMKLLVDSGKARAIGLSNFNILKTKRILEVARIKPAVNQVELHPYLPQHDLLNFYRKEGLHLMAHQPLGGKPVGVVAPNSHLPGPLDDAEIAEIAAECGKSSAQVILSWAVQRGTSVVPKTVNNERLKQNLDIFKLSDEHFHRIDSLSDRKGVVRFLVPTSHIGFDIFDESRDEPVGNYP